MKLRKEVLDRFLLAKAILSPAMNGISAQSNAHIIARQLLNAHDAADLVFAAIADQTGKLPAKGRTPAMIQCLSLLGPKANKHSGYFKQLNEARNGLKHAGNLPNTTQWLRVAHEVFQRLSNICLIMLRVRLEDIDELSLVTSDEIRAYLSTAKQRSRTNEFRLALEELGKALCTALSEDSDLGGIEVGSAKAEDALKLTALGVPANEFLRLQEFLPKVSRFLDEPFKIRWKQNEFGHPGNWRRDVVEFCFTTCLEAILSIQSAAAVPTAVELQYLYEYVVTAEQDQVEVWEDLIKEPLDGVYAGGPRPFRERKRYLAKGESIRVSAATEPLVSDDLSIDGTWIKRVQISTDNYSSILPDGRAEFVNLAHVEISCVPYNYESMQERFQNLVAIPWQPDPDEHFWPELNVAPVAEEPEREEP